MPITTFHSSRRHFEKPYSTSLLATELGHQVTQYVLCTEYVVQETGREHGVELPRNQNGAAASKARWPLRTCKSVEIVTQYGVGAAKLEICPKIWQTRDHLAVVTCFPIHPARPSPLDAFLKE